MYQPSEALWTNLTGLVFGTAPAPRAYVGFAACRDMLYLFGGWSDFAGDSGGPRHLSSVAPARFVFPSHPSGGRCCRFVFVPACERSSIQSKVGAAAAA